MPFTYIIVLVFLLIFISWPYCLNNRVICLNTKTFIIYMYVCYIINKLRFAYFIKYNIFNTRSESFNSIMIKVFKFMYYGKANFDY